MKDFTGRDFLLTNIKGEYLYRHYAQKLNIFDYHCHLNPRDIAEDRKFNNVGELMLEGDHYKWRIMRAYGIDENNITGIDVSYKDKFFSFAEALPFFIGNPVYHWVHMELNKYFGIKTPLSGKTAERVWEEANAKIKEGKFNACSLITDSNVEFAATTDDPSSNLEWHTRIAERKDFNTRIVPTWRPDRVMDITSADYMAYLDELASTEDMKINSLDDLLDLMKKRMDFFEANGCCIADHALTNSPTVCGTYYDAKAVLAKKLFGVEIGTEEAEKFKFFILFFFGCEYYARNWVMQMHLSTIRNQNTRLFKLLGPDSGLDSCGELVDITALRSLFDRIEMDRGMPKTILYTMNPSAYYPLATLAGTFTGGIPGKIQLGAAWWMLDHRDGITEQLKTLANTGGLGLHVGMLTDSRSLLSYVRHDYYRRILCSLIGKWVQSGEVPDDEELLETLIRSICIENARRYFNTGRQK